MVNEDSSGTILILKNEIKRLKKEMYDQDRLFQKMLGEAKEGSSKASTEQGGICKLCKMNSIIDSMEMDGEAGELLGDDSLLLDDSIDEGEDFGVDEDVRDSAEFRKGLIQLKSQSQVVKDAVAGSPALRSARQGSKVQLYKLKLKRMAMRLTQAESLLEKNLAALTDQKKHYDGELTLCKEQLSKHMTAYDALSLQVNRDKMKLKFREDKILKLEQEHAIDYDQELQNLRDEVKLANEQLE